jgi:hypothetical protein
VGVPGFRVVISVIKALVIYKEYLELSAEIPVMHDGHWTLDKTTWKSTSKPLTWSTVIYQIQTGCLVCFSETEQIIFISPSGLCCLENVEASTSHNPWGPPRPVTEIAALK